MSYRLLYYPLVCLLTLSFLIVDSSVTRPPFEDGCMVAYDSALDDKCERIDFTYSKNNLYNKGSLLENSATDYSSNTRRLSFPPAFNSSSTIVSFKFNNTLKNSDFCADSYHMATTSRIVVLRKFRV